MNDTFQFDQVLLRWDEFYWCGSLDMPLMGSTGIDVELGVHAKDEEQIAPCSKQLETWANFVGRNEEILNAILEAGFSYYQQVRPEYAKAGPEWIERMPEIKNVRELAQMIQLRAIVVYWPYDDAAVQVGVEFGCDWDPEHGFGVLVEGDKVADVGDRDCAYA